MTFAPVVRPWFILIGTMMVFCAGCGRTPAKIVVPPLPRIEIADVLAPPAASVVVQKGSNLREIATAAYFHEDFSGFVGVLNGVSAPEKLQGGATLKTPSLPVALRDAGMDARYQPAINALAKAWNDFAEALPAHTKARNAHGARDGETFPISADMQARLIRCADMVDAAIDVLRHPREGHAAPQRSISQFAGASGSLRRFASGVVESHDYDTFLAEKGFGLGFTQLLIWTQEHHQ